MPEPPTDGWEIGPNPSVPTAEQVYEIFIHFFNAYLLSVTSLLIYSIIVLVVLYRFRAAGSYGTQSKRKYLNRFTKSLLLVSALFPLLYAAMWIAEGTTTAGPDLPAGGVFGTPIEERIIGPNPTTTGMDQFLAILIDIFQFLFTSWTTLGVIAVMALVAGYYTNRLPREFRVSSESTYLYRMGAAVTFILTLLPLLYLMVWIATDTQKTPDALPADGIFGTTIEERLIGPETGQSINGLVSALGNAFQTYQVTISFILISIITFLGVSYALINWPFNLDIGDRQEHLYRAALGLGGSLAMVPILYATSWVAVGLRKPTESFTRVAPPVPLPTEQLFGGPRFHPVIEELAASKDPVEAVLLNFISFQTTSYVALGILVLSLGMISMLYLSRLSWFPDVNPQHHTRAGIIILIVVFLAPGLVIAHCTCSRLVQTYLADATLL